MQLLERERVRRRIRRATMTATAFLVLSGLAVALAFGSGYSVGLTRGEATIGGTSVPIALECPEDHAISWTGIDTLDCVPLETLESRS